jgi:hypothetical protein
MPEPRPFKRYTVTARRTVTEEWRKTIEARNIHEARAIAAKGVDSEMSDPIPETMDMVGQTIRVETFNVEEE